MTDTERIEQLMSEVVRVAPSEMFARLTVRGGVTFGEPSMSGIDPSMSDANSSRGVFTMLDAMEKAGFDTALSSPDPVSIKVYKSDEPGHPVFVYIIAQTRAEAVARAFVKVFSEGDFSASTEPQTSSDQSLVTNEGEAN